MMTLCQDNVETCDHLQYDVICDHLRLELIPLLLLSALEKETSFLQTVWKFQEVEIKPRWSYKKEIAYIWNYGSSLLANRDLGADVWFTTIHNKHYEFSRGCLIRKMTSHYLDGIFVKGLPE